MNRRRLAALVLSLGIASGFLANLIAAESDSAIQFVERLEEPIALRPLHPPELKFEQPVWCSPVPGLTDALIALEHQTGKAWLLHGAESPDDESIPDKTLFADWGAAVSDGPWEGLMCIAFHPRFPENRRFFIKHETLIRGRRHTVVVEKHARPDLLTDSGMVSRPLFAIEQPADNHNGGTLAFGPDGFLYIAMGDGGPQEDPQGYTQSGRALLGKMLRIDVDRPSDTLPYGIPPDNPFVDLDPNQWHPEIWALGFREPWRFSFDRETGDLWLGDVGQVLYEEVLIVRRGENHGWNVREGHRPFKDTYWRSDETYTEPLLAYGRHVGASITGGYVYRGSRHPSWNGVYLFGDFNTRRLFGLRGAGGKVEALLDIGLAPEAPASFGEGRDGELFLVGYSGTIFQLDLSGADFPAHRPLATTAWQENQEEVRLAAEEIMGPFPGPERRVDLQMRTLQEVDGGRHVRKLIDYQSESGSRTPAYLCVPKKVLKPSASPVPAVLCLHPTDMRVGHQVVVGLGGRPGRQYAAELAERGFVTLSPAYPLLADYWPNLSQLGYESGTMKAIWDNSRGLDLLESLPFVEGESGFAAIGHSLGGHNALFSALFDDRLTAVVSSCGFDAFEDYYDGDRANWFFGKGWCQLRYMPRLSDYRGRLDKIPFDFPDLLEALTPRRVFINAPRHDSNFRWRSVERLVAEVREWDTRFQLDNRLEVRHPEAGHDFPTEIREEAYEFIASQIGNP